METLKYGGIVAGRIRAAVDGNEAVRQRLAMGAVAVKIDGEPTAGQVLWFIATTGLPAGLLLCRLNDLERGVGDVGHFDTHR
jgi:hypothetical protein